MLVALVALAVADLIVGVSNDAVNFLNSALGSKVLSFRTIMIVASIGIFIGCVFSSGMMEVARKGIFNPGEFYFNEIMIIFMAVMITDILLLEFFNSVGMPTSTTVSIVFELLGASVAMALIKIGIDNGSFGMLLIISIPQKQPKLSLEFYYQYLLHLQLVPSYNGFLDFYYPMILIQNLIGWVLYLEVSH